MPKLSKADTERLPRVHRSLAQILEAMAVLQDHGDLTQEALARAMAVNQGYLSTLAKDVSAARLTSKKLEVMTRGLRRVVDAHETQLRTAGRYEAADEPLAEVEAHWGWPPLRLVAPGGIVLAHHANCIRRSSDIDLESRIGDAATLLIHGPPQSGRTSLVRRGAEVARSRGLAVAVADLTAMPVDGTIADACQVIAEAVTGDLEVECRDWEGVDGLVDDWVTASPSRGAILVLDGVSSGQRAVVRQVLARIRLWHNNRARNTISTRGWERMAIWVVTSSQRVEDARYLSPALLSREIGSTSSVDVRWFNHDEVGALTSAYVGSRPGEASDPASKAVVGIRSLLGGQPTLTHEAVAAWAARGQMVRDWAAAQPMALQMHLRLLADVIVSEPVSLRVVQQSEGQAAGWTPMLVELGVFGVDDEWACDLYRTDLPRYVRLAAERAEGARGGEA